MSTNTPTVYIPRDTTALSLGADKVAAQLSSQQPDITIVRNGSRGLFWLEPMIEVTTPLGRVAYGPVQPEDVASLLASDFLQGDNSHPLYLGLTEEIPYLAQQQRVTFARVGITDPVSLADYRAYGGLVGLQKALALTPQSIVDEVKTSGLRGRGGAAFPTGIKWQTVLNAPSNKKYIVCNADEGDSGTFADRMLMEGDPYCLIEGMIISGLAVGADQGYIYLREEYPVAHQILNEAIATAESENILGDNVLGSGKAFNLQVRLGAGAYICGEETSLLESLEGKRGMVRAKPPLPAIVGLFGQPTIVNNVISLASVPDIMANGAEQYQEFGTGRSRGTLPFQLAGNIKYGGLVELAFGATLQTLLQDFGGGTRSGKPMRTVQIGGPLGAYLPEQLWGTPLDYEAFIAIGAGVGHGGIVAFDDSVNLSQQARFSMEFCTIESCGKCTPCRIGSTRGVEVIDRITNNEQREENLELLEELCDTMVHGSLCAMGGMTPIPVTSALKHFPEDFSPAEGANSSSQQQGAEHA
ncbi:NADH-ubiquinone oxidoreductase-F iron-sulfur binding region domain-containing protein [Dasania marina]|uniref:formate dehydrogenase beta subunit n=1 Tax=Dasania marina TaxID=471499 RepID=UPI0030D74A79|tara:strand:+ start:11258 stop:12838 length:1581 start_codon:yes stop_codon:yes gene_type:complete